MHQWNSYGVVFAPMLEALATDGDMKAAEKESKSLVEPVANIR